jgi:diguanylate cyclase (GGDEF)-like protein/putative nucleotidyltransferase with HDIG domain
MLPGLRTKLFNLYSRARLSTRVLLFFIVASLVPLYVLLYLSDQANSEILRQQQLRDLTSRSSALSAQIDGQLQEWSRRSLGLSKEPVMAQLIAGQSPGLTGDATQTLTRVIEVDPSVRVAFLMDLSGKVVASSDPALLGNSDLAHNQFFQEAAAGTLSISDLSVGILVPLPSIYLSAPVRDPLGKVLGVAVVRASPEKIYGFFNPQLLGNERYAFLVDQHGIVIGSSEPQQGRVLYHSLGPLNDTVQQQLRIDRTFGDAPVQSLDMQTFSEQVTGATSPGSTSAEFKPTGQPQVFGYAPLGSKRWVVVVAQPTDAFLAPMDQARNNTILYTTLVAGVFVLLIFLVTRLFERTERESLTDSLTSLPNRRYFLEIMERELTRSQRTHRPLSLINVDLDHFKTINDEYGHPKGDDILRNFARVLKEQIRSIDLPVRYGGEEFMVLLPDTDKEGAVMVAEKIRRATDRLSIPRLGSMPGRTVTASAGVATYPEDAPEGEQLMRCSDQAMYLAKNLGRNQVIGYGTEAGITSLAKNPERVHLLVQNANKATIEALAAAIDARDTYTHGHSHRVADYARIIASEIEDEAIDMESLHLGALLHDVGKIGVSDVLLRKPGKLTPEEFETIKGHAQIGFEMLQGVDFLRTVAPIILHHHENFGGGGYPRGLAGKAIPVESRIIMVSDAFDAMTSTRTYREGGPVERALAELEKHAGRQFDPDVVEALKRAIRKGKLRLLPQPPMTAAQLEAIAAGQAAEPKAAADAG